MISQVEALAKFCDVQKSDVKSCGYDKQVFIVGDKEYLVLTNAEADIRCSEYIKDTLWAFRTEFLLPYTCLPQNENGEKSLVLIQEKCEDSNECLIALVKNMDGLIEDAILSDGRGHFLASYDGKEHEEGRFFIYRIN